MGSIFKKNQMSSEEIHKNRWIILAIVVLLPLMASLDSNIVNIALPTIEADLKINMASAEWVVSAYLIIISATILLFGRIGDMKSKGLVFINGIIVFTVGSLLCGMSINIYLLVASRVIQAIGAGLVMSTNQGIITAVFPATERGKALGITGSAVALGALIGPALGGIIVTYLTWHYIFLINVPIGVVAYFLARKFIPINMESKNEKMDGKGASTFFVAIVLIFSAIMVGQQVGFTDIYIIIAFIIGFIALAVFIFVEKKAKAPMLDLSLFRNSTFSINLICACISFISINTISIIEPFYLQDALGYSAFTAAMIMMSYPVVMLVVAPLSGHISDKIGNGKLNVIGILITGISIIMLSTLNVDSSIVKIVLFLCLLGLANGLFQSPNTSAIMSSVPKNKLGIAGGTNALIRNVGLAIGVSVSTTILYSDMSRIVGHKVLGFIPGKPNIFVSAMQDVYLMVSLLCFVAFVLFIANIVKTKALRKEASYILLFGRIGDMKSKGLVFINGIIVFTLGSLFCGISPNIYLLVASRAIQAIGAALVMSTNQGIITAVFPASERGRALGITGSAVALGALIGPGLGGIIITYLTWHYIFLINVPIGAIAYILARKYIPVKESKSNEKIDGKGVITFFISIVFIFSAIMFGQQIGFSDVYIVVAFIIGFFSLAIFIYIEKKVKSPMLDLSLFKNLTFSTNLICACISFIAINTVSIIEPFYLQDALGYSAFYAAVIMMSSPVIMFVVAPLSGYISDKIGYEILNIIGILIIGISLMLLSTLNTQSDALKIVLFLSLLGFANGLFKSPNTSAIMSSVPKDKLGIAGGTNALIRNIGLAVGVSVSTTFLYRYMSKLAGYRVLGFIQGEPDIFIYAMRDVYLMVSILCFIAFILYIINMIKTRIARKKAL